MSRAPRVATLWRRTGPGGSRGLQILLPGANPVRGGFDSHASPPTFAVRAVALALALAVSTTLGTGPALGARPLAGEGPAPSLAALGSLALPGTGQVLNGKWVKAVGFFGAYAGFLAWGISINQDKQEAEGRLNAAAEADRPLLQAEVDGLENGRNAKVWFAGLTLLLSMADAYVDAHLRGFGERIDAEVGFIPGGVEPVFGVRLTAPLGEGAGS